MISLVWDSTDPIDLRCETLRTHDLAHRVQQELRVLEEVVDTFGAQVEDHWVGSSNVEGSSFIFDF